MFYREGLAELRDTCFLPVRPALSIWRLHRPCSELRARTPYPLPSAFDCCMYAESIVVQPVWLPDLFLAGVRSCDAPCLFHPEPYGGLVHLPGQFNVRCCTDGEREVVQPVIRPQGALHGTLLVLLQNG